MGITSSLKGTAANVECIDTNLLTVPQESQKKRLQLDVAAIVQYEVTPGKGV